MARRSGPVKFGMTSSNNEDAHRAEGWRVGARLPIGGWTVGVVAREDGSGWVLREAGLAGQPRAELFSVDVGGQIGLCLERPGHAVAAAFGQGTLAVLGKRPGGGFWLAVRPAGCADWQYRGEVQVESLSALLVVSPVEIWALGQDCIGRWIKGSWEEVKAPAVIDQSRARLFVVGPIVALGTPEGLFLWREGERRWGRRGLEGAHVQGLSGAWIAAPDPEGGIRIGELEEAWVRWLGGLRAEARVLKLVCVANPPVEGVTGRTARMQLLLLPVGPDEGIVLVRSVEGGGLGVQQLRLPASPARIDIAGARGVLAVTADQRVLQSGASS